MITSTEQAVLDWLRRGIMSFFAGSAPDVLWAPPVIAAETVARTGYPESFPQLLARVVPEISARNGVAPGETAELVLAPAACHHLYPLLAGREISSPTVLTVEGSCFRNEATAELGRLRSFRMREIVYVSDPDDCVAWRDDAVVRIREWFSSLGLAVAAEPADDPFFGPGARLLRTSQREQELKWELRADLGPGVPQAIASCNYHKEHFSAAFGFHGTDGAVLHSACVAFGLERLVLALQHAHGPDPARWPAWEPATSGEAVAPATSVTPAG
jgi:hypothetical protein